MKKIVVGMAAVAAVAGGGYFALQAYADARAAAAVGQVKETLPDGVAFSHGEIEANAFTGSIVIRDVHISTPRDGELSAASVSVDGAEEREGGGLEADHISIASLTVEAPDGTDISIAVFELSDASLPNGFDHMTPEEVFDAIVTREIRLEDLEVKDDDGIVTMDDAILTDLSQGRLGNLQASRTRFEQKTGDTPGTMNVGRLSIGPLDTAEIRQGSQDGLGGIDHLTVSDVEFDLQGTGRFGIERISIDGVARAGAVISRFDASVKGFELDVADLESPQARDAFGRLGYESLAFDADLRPRYDGGARSFELELLSISMRDAGTLTLEMSLDAITIPDPAMGNPGIDHFMDATVKRVEIGYVDNSLVDRSVKAAATANGTEEAVIRQGIIAEIDSAFGRSGGPLGRELAAALAEFVQDPGELAIVAAPAEPVRISDLVMGAMMAPAMVAEEIGLSIVNR